MLAQIVLIVFTAGIQLGGLLLMVHDKKQSQKRRAERVPESRFVWIALFGGFMGIMIAALTVRHKTRKWQFWAKVLPAGILGMAVLLGWYWLLTPQV